MKTLVTNISFRRKEMDEEELSNEEIEAIFDDVVDEYNEEIWEE